MHLLLTANYNCFNVYYENRYTIQQRSQLDANILCFADYTQVSNQVIAGHSDSIIDDGIATAAYKLLPTLRSPAACQDSDGG